MRALVAGDRGYLGAVIVPYLQRAGHEVVGLDAGWYDGCDFGVPPSSYEQRTVSAGVPNDLIRGDVFFWQSLMAAALIPAIPIALLYNAFLDRFIKGFTGGAFR